MNRNREENLKGKFVHPFKVVAFIPVRGGSKGIPMKNIRNFFGKPLVYWALKAASECDRIEKIFVSTDSDHIRDTVNRLGFSKVFVLSRSSQTATDDASTESAMLEFMGSIEFEHIVLIQATSPLLESRDLEGGLFNYFKGKYDALLSVVKQKRFVWKECGNAWFPLNYDPKIRPRRQEMKGFYVENGAFYITSRKALLSSQSRLSGRIGIFEMSEDTYFEVDEISDWVISENLKGARIRCTRRCDIKLLICDVDGVLTDAGMYYDEKGNEFKKFSARDGMGFELLHRAGIKIMLITSEDTEIVRRRANKLKIDYVLLGVKDKKVELDAFLLRHKEFNYAVVAYIGDDINDAEALQNCAFSAAPADAHNEILKLVDYRCKNRGGAGCVREVCDLVLEMRTMKNGKEY